MKRVKKPWGSCPQTEPPSLPSPPESFLGREAPGLSLQRFSSTYSAALLRADTNQAPSKPSPPTPCKSPTNPHNHSTALPAPHELSDPCPSGSFKLPKPGYHHTHPAVCATQESCSQDHLGLVTQQLPTERQHPPCSLLPAQRTQPPKSLKLPHSLLGGCRVSPARVAHLLFAEFQ